MNTEIANPDAVASLLVHVLAPAAGGLLLGLFLRRLLRWLVVFIAIKVLLLLLALGGLLSIDLADAGARGERVGRFLATVAAQTVETLPVYRPVWEREKRAGLRPSEMLGGCVLFFGARELPRVAAVVITALCLHMAGAAQGLSLSELVTDLPRPATSASLVHASGWPSAAIAWLMTGMVLALVALAGTAFGLAVSGLCKRPVLAQQWLACVLLAQILLTVPLAHDANPSARYEPHAAAAWVHAGAQWLTAVLWGHDLLKTAGDPGRWGWMPILANLLRLLGLTAAALVLARLGLGLTRRDR